MRRFINADIIAGDISNVVTLNRFAYANGNPVSYTDPFGLGVVITLILIGAGVGGLLSGIESAIEQREPHGKIDIEEVIVDATCGAFDGGVSASPMGFAGEIIITGVVSAGNSISDQYFDSGSKSIKDFNLVDDLDHVEVAVSVAIDVTLQLPDIKSLNRMKLVNDYISKLEGRIAFEKAHPDGETSEALIKMLEPTKSDIMNDTIKDIIVQPFGKDALLNHSVHSIADSLLSDESYSDSRK